MGFHSPFTTSVWASIAFWAISICPNQATGLSASSQLTSFNSTFSLSPQQISDANFTLSDVDSVNSIIKWEQSQYAGGPTTEDTFYNLPTIANGSNLSPGTLIKTEDFTNITTYSLSPNLALSRILYMSRNLNGSSVPASAFIQGTEDAFVPYAVTTATVGDTCTLFPGNEIRYVVSNGTGHVPTLDASRMLWMGWIGERFEGKSVDAGKCGGRSELESFLPIERYQATGNSFVQWAGEDQYSYEIPLAL